MKVTMTAIVFARIRFARIQDDRRLLCAPASTDGSFGRVGLESVQRPRVYSDIYGSVHYKEPLKVIREE